MTETPEEPRTGLSGHYYDLFQLAAQSEVVAILRSDEYAAIKADYDAISRAYFPQSYFCPSEMSFAGSDGLFPQGNPGAHDRR